MQSLPPRNDAAAPCVDVAGEALLSLRPWYYLHLCVHQALISAAGEHGYKEEQAETYLGEKFWKSVPPRNGSSALWNDDAAVSAAEAPLQLVSLNHMALGVEDVQTMTK